MMWTIYDSAEDYFITTEMFLNRSQRLYDAHDVHAGRDADNCAAVRLKPIVMVSYFVTWHVSSIRQLHWVFDAT